MKSTHSPLASLMLAAALAHGDLVIVQKVEGGGQSGEQTIRIKGDKARTDLAQPVSIINDAATGDSVTLMHAQRNFLKVPAAQVKAMIEQVQKTRANASPPKLVDTGRHEKIGEYECEIFTASLGFVNITYWVAKNYPNYQGIIAQMEKAQPGGISAMAQGVMPPLKDFPGMPIKTEMDLSGKKLITLVVSVKQDTVDPAIFKIPPIYKEVTAPELDLQRLK